MDATLDPVDAYRTLLLYRRFEEEVGAAVLTGEIHGEMHLGIGQEAIAVAMGGLLHPGDAVVSTHRPHLHGLALGVDPVEMLAELLERDGLCGGKGGHMHLFDAERRFMCTGIVGAGAPQAAGYAFTQIHEPGDAVTIGILGDGAMNQGAVFETMNLAALMKLPLVMLCEDNLYGISVGRDQASAGALEDRGRSFGIPGIRVDGTDVEQTYAVLRDAMARARRREGPSLVVAECYRWRGHYEGDLDLYRSQEEKEAAKAERDPVAKQLAKLTEAGVAGELVAAIGQQVDDQIARWFEEARSRPMPAVARVREGVFV